MYILMLTCVIQGSEPFQSVSGKADRSNGYVKGNQDMADVQPKASEMVWVAVEMWSTVYIHVHTCV